MTSTHDTGRLADLSDRLSPLADSLDPPPVYWVGGGDAGLNYCRKCCAAQIRIERRLKPSCECWIDGGWDVARESDGGSACATCGVTLGYRLSRSALCEEIYHFADVIEKGFAAPFRNEDAYAVRAVLNAALYSDEPEVVAKAVRIGEAAVAALSEVTA